MEQQTYKTDAAIYDVLEREIIDLTIRPGSSLSENPLCTRFGAPRSLIRVVLQKLQENGLVKIVPYKGTTVTRLNREIVEELIYERTAVEARVLRDFSPRCTPEQRALIRKRAAAYEALAHAVIAELERQSATLPRADIVRKSLADWSAVVLVPDMDAAIALANRVAPEHLEVLMREPWSVLPRIRHAGAVFLGPYAPEPLGDYFAGPNHVLHTLGTARFSSALSVQTFCKRTSIIAASPAFAAAHADAVARLARMEQLEAHARSMECRKQ